MQYYRYSHAGLKLDRITSMKKNLTNEITTDQHKTRNQYLLFLSIFICSLFLSFIPCNQRVPTALVLMADTPGNTMAASTALNLWSTVKWTFQWFLNCQSIIITQVFSKKSNVFKYFYVYIYIIRYYIEYVFSEIISYNYLFLFILRVVCILEMYDWSKMIPSYITDLLIVWNTRLLFEYFII